MSNVETTVRSESDESEESEESDEIDESAERERCKNFESSFGLAAL